eukprot:scaffold216562_cov65-Attheya_sp.AAC.3
MTTSDEAFILLVSKNNWDIFNEVENVEPMYTSKGSTSNRRNDGWTNGGIMQYNKLVVQVKKNRKYMFSYEVEEEVINVLYEMENGIDARRKHDAPQDDNTTNGKSGSIRKKKHATEENCTIPIIDLDSSDDED